MRFRYWFEIKLKKSLVKLFVRDEIKLNESLQMRYDLRDEKEKCNRAGQMVYAAAVNILQYL